MYFVIVKDDAGWVFSSEDMVDTFLQCGIKCSEYKLYDENVVTTHKNGNFGLHEITRTFKTFKEAEDHVRARLNFPKPLLVKDCPAGTFVKIKDEILLITNERRLVSVKTLDGHCSGYLTSYIYDND